MRRETFETLLDRLLSSRRAAVLLALGLAITAAVLSARGSASLGTAFVLGAFAGGFLIAQWLYQTRIKTPLGGNASSAAADISPDAKALISLLDLPALITDAGGTIRLFNRQAQLIYPQIEIGQPLIQLSRNPGLLSAVERARSEHTTQTGEITERGPSGRNLRATVSPVATEAADGTGFYLVQLRDLSEQNRLTQLRSDFIANASHELRTPLASLKGFVETLQGPASNDERARIRFLNIMAAQSARMTRILDDLLSLSRIEMRAHVRPTDAVDINSIVRAAVHGLEPIAADAEIALTLVAADSPAMVLGDKDQLEQVFQNLIENAIKYGHAGGLVDVRVALTSRSGKIEIAIEDDGPGIADVHLPRLTERFYRVDTKTSRERGGTGLGLAIVKHILNRHGGELDITSKVGKGSTFTVTLDAAAATAAPAIDQDGFK